MGVKEGLIEDVNELNDKISRLRAFIEYGGVDLVDGKQTILLTVQLSIMNTYLTVLNNRIELL